MATAFISSSPPPISEKVSWKTKIVKLIFISSIFSLLLLISSPYFAPFNDIRSFMGVLKGLGGFGATTITANSLPRSGPITIPDFKTCRAATFPDRIKPVNCCPPVSTKEAVDFTLLPPPKAMRVRRAVHLLDDEYVAKFSRAVRLMRELPDDDPRSFKQQANVHCAHCLGAHRHVGFPDMILDIHGCWLFFPFHRLYIYFFERILGKLIDDPNFALPYWNWDSPQGMRMPESFADVNSPLYEKLRDKKHQPPVLLDLNYNMTDSTVSAQHQMITNLAVMYRQVVSGGRTPELFFGSSYHPGDEPNPGVGSIEIFPHTAIHNWVGDRDQPSLETMGPFYSAARDPLFYSHHSNIDRIWTIWKTLRGGKRTDLTDPDWLNSEFMFYDEEARLVKVKVRDCLDTRKLGYIYEEVPVPWVNTRPTPRVSELSRNTKKKKNMANSTNVFPIKLDEVVRVVVARQTKPRNEKEREEEEVLVIEGIEVGGDKLVKFDVIINDGGDEAGIGPEKTEFAGSFMNHPSLHDNHGKKKKKSTLRLGISELLKDLGAEDDESVVVTLVPKYDSTADSVTISGIKIVFSCSS